MLTMWLAAALAAPYPQPAPVVASEAADAAHGAHRVGLGVGAMGAGLGTIALWGAGTNALLLALAGRPDDHRYDWAVAGGFALSGVGLGVAVLAPVLGAARMRRVGIRVSPIAGWLGVGLWTAGATAAIGGSLLPAADEHRGTLVHGGIGAMWMSAGLGAGQDHTNLGRAREEMQRVWTIDMLRVPL